MGAIQSNEFKLIPEETMLNELEKDYRNMRDMIYGEVPSFIGIVESLTNLEEKLNEK